jgi:hypothetical protein
MALFISGAIYSSEIKITSQSPRYADSKRLNIEVHVVPSVSEYILVFFSLDGLGFQASSH